jgi:L-lactate dehydrogenase
LPFLCLLFQVAWSAATVSGQPLSRVLALSHSELTDIADKTRDKAASIIAAKGFTSFGVAAATARICESIIFDQRHVLPVSHWQENFSCCLSVPAVLGRRGIVSTVPFQLEEAEKIALKKSADSIRNVMATCEKYF